MMETRSGVDGDRMKGTNSWSGSGKVIGDVNHSKTRVSGDHACSFRVMIKQPPRRALYLRINAYSGNAVICKDRDLSEGDFVVITGELMHRPGNDDMLTEVRCQDIVIVKKGEEDNANAKRWRRADRSKAGND